MSETLFERTNGTSACRTSKMRDCLVGKSRRCYSQRSNNNDDRQKPPKDCGAKAVTGIDETLVAICYYCIMVAFENALLEDAKADAITITSAFRAASVSHISTIRTARTTVAAINRQTSANSVVIFAQDDDVRKAMNALSNPAQAEGLKFYIVPKSWVLKAWPLLTARSHDDVEEGWRENIGIIQNAELMNVEHEVSSSDEETSAEDQRKKRLEKLHLRMAKNRSDGVMKPGLEHMKDFFFVGPSAWMIIKEKFGSDGYELERPCVSTGSSQNPLAIELKAEESEGNTPRQIFVPPSGRFANEKVLLNQAIISQRHTLVPDEDKGSSELSGAAAAQDGTSTDDQPILMLPPSTTGMTESNNSYQTADVMEVEGENTQMSGRKRLASGLGNLGNTCFMNSTLQCLAHTEPLRKYFLSGEYESDLNRDNPLGTGGELAMQFAALIREMWGLPSKRRNVLGTETSYGSSLSSAIYPRNFKHCVGKHAEQFMGYDQHDSQEFATYLLDALHEDTNRITKKPYIEKPEQGEDEPDDVAAGKAWSLHLQREDSRVLENFMGQVKSRLECSEETCNRVSTTFDPFMYLSVPIPGATDRKLKVTFVPLDPTQRPMNLSLTVSKTAQMGKVFVKMNEELIKLGVREESIPLHDLIATDIWAHEIFSWYKHDSEIDKIRESDETFIFELAPQSEITEASKKGTEEVCENEQKLSKTRSHPRIRLDLETLTQLNKDDDWQSELEKYVKHTHVIYSLFNEKRGSIDDRMQFYKKLESFIDQCHKEIEEEEEPSLKRNREDIAEPENSSDIPDSDMEEGTIQGLADRCDASPTFTNVHNKRDVAVLEFCANKIRQLILKLIRQSKDKFKNGITIHVSMKKSQNTYSQGSKFATPFALRIPSTLTVFDLRKVLAIRLSRCLKTEELQRAGESSEEGDSKVNPVGTENGESFGSPELLIMRQVPLSYDQKSSYSTRSNFSSSKQLGMVENGSENRESVLASRSNEAEKELVANIVGEFGAVIMQWPADLCSRFFDLAEYEEVEDIQPEEGSNKAEKSVTTVTDCIEKYCQMEQLEESEMWYCNRCKKHVRAWKQFHLYRAPPILIVHLKRFHYSASTHRRDKITSFIDFPLEGLDLTEMVSHYTDETKPIYDCYGVSNHYGGLGGGHYTAYILNDDGTWCYYDDTRVTTQVEIKEVVSDAAYVLYYRRRDVPVGQDFVVENSPHSHMICEPVEDMARDPSEVSSNNSTSAVIDDDMVVDGNSGNVSFPDDLMDTDILTSETDDFSPGKDDFPPLQ
eukprot:scaffold6124_cov122-Cylindrotheca_fusiformis.AAC.28